MKKSRVVIIGYGNIGRTLHERLYNRSEWDVAYTITSKGASRGAPGALDHNIVRNEDAFDDIDLAFLAIPTLDDGMKALGYIQALLQKGVPVVTCEKGALSNHFEALRPCIKRIGFSATVGGGSGIIDFLRGRFCSRTQEVHAILNGTLNFIWDELRTGNPLAHIVADSKKLGYAEPGEKDPIRIILGEACMDATKKTAILFNLCFDPDPFISARNISCDLTKVAIRRAIREARSRRFVVSFQRRLDAQLFQDSDDISAFRYVNSDWIITGGFKNLANPLIARLCEAAPWVNNGILTVEGDGGEDGVYLCAGPGAGPEPTTAAMIRDAERLLA